MTIKRALLVVHRGSPSVKRMVAAARQRGLVPLVISNAPASPCSRRSFEATCNELEVEAHIFDHLILTEQDCMQVIGAQSADFIFALALWDGQRQLMARMNEVFGAPDLSPAVVRGIQDKLLFRRQLMEHGLTRLEAVEAREFLASGIARSEPGPWIVKPRRGMGSVCTRISRTEADMEEILARFAAGAVSEDIFTEIYSDNELIVEDYFEGQEFSLELFMQDGRCLFACDHEKVRLTATTQTILEHSFASPCVALDPEVIEQARDFALRSFEVLHLHSGWFHAEMRVNPAGRFEFIEINPRCGGGLIPESIRRQSGRTPMIEWCQLLSGTKLAPSTERRCGTYQQCAYAKDSGPIQSFLRSALVREPDVELMLKQRGDVCLMDREDIVGLMLWETSLDRHASEVAALSVVEYMDVVTQDAARSAACAVVG